MATLAVTGSALALSSTGAQSQASGARTPLAATSGGANSGALSAASRAASSSARGAVSPSDTGSPSSGDSGSASPSATATAGGIVVGAPTLALPAQTTLPGTLSLTYPDQGQVEIEIAGQGVIGSYGPVATAQPIASITKTMTAYDILRDHPLSVGEQGPSITITAADVADYQYDQQQNMSSVVVQAGEEITENQALEALMLPSADNIADLLAQWDAGTESAFVAKMNSTAASLGMTHTSFTDDSGYDPGSVSDSNDLITLAQTAMQNSYFAHLVDESSATIPVAGTISNTDTLLGTYGIDGIKTGSTGQAGGCLLFNANLTVDGQSLGLVGSVLGQDAPTDTELGLGLQVAKALVSSAESQISEITLEPAGTVVAYETLSDGTSVPLSITQPLEILGWPGEPVTLTLGGIGTNDPTLRAVSPTTGRMLAGLTLS